VIGKYGENTERLRQVQALASIKGYHAILLKDYEDIQELSLPEKALLFGLLSCFVICDDTVASGHNEELPILANAGFVIAILCPTTGCSSWMHAHFPTSFRNVRVFEYSSDISARIQEAILWAEQQAQQVTRDWNELYPWRQATFPRGTD
ncbi:MAG TPA: hypothetical protein VNM68_12810, partial [Candidatus Polarisedimenticolia bacterium]|nr:hypothetical protein [Candidatus Polarisedimenticolia bacterium]